MGESASPYLRIVGNRAPEPRDTSSEGASGASPDVVFITDAEGTVLYVNRSLPDVHQDDVLGTSFYDYILPEHHFAVRAANERVFGTGEPGGYEILGMTGHSSESWYDCRVVPTMRGGRVVSATVIARDVTLRKRIEENLRRELEDTKRLLAGVHDDLHRASAVESPGSAASPAQMALFREIIDRAGEAMFVVDPVNGQILDANGTACRWVSHRLEDLVTQKEADLRLRFPLRVPESYGDHVTDTRDLARPQIFRGEHRRTDGSSFPVEVAITRHIVGGRAFVLSVARDSKSRQQLEQALFEAEDKYRALFELSQDAIYISNRDGSIAEVNDAAAEMFHFTKDEFRGFPAKKLYTNSDDIRTFQREVATHGYVRDVEVAFTKKDGTSFRGLLTATLRHAGDRNVLGYQCVIRRSMERTSPLAPPTRHALEEFSSWRTIHGTGTKRAGCWPWPG
jgi:PAS domain S-box-containing protein